MCCRSCQKEENFHEFISFISSRFLEYKRMIDTSPIDDMANLMQTDFSSNKELTLDQEHVHIFTDTTWIKDSSCVAGVAYKGEKKVQFLLIEFG